MLLSENKIARFGRLLIDAVNIVGVAIGIAIGVLTSWSCMAFHGKGNNTITPWIGGNRRTLHLMCQSIKTITEPTANLPIIIVNWGAEHIQLRALTLLYYLLTSISKLSDSTLLRVEHYPEVLAAHFYTSVHGLYFRLLCSILRHFHLGQTIGCLEQELFVHLLITSLCPRLVGAGKELRFEEILGIGVKFGHLIVRNRHHALFAGGDGNVIVPTRTSYLLTVLPKGEMDGIVEGLEIVFIEDFHLIGRGINPLNADVLVNLLHFKILSLRREIWAHHTVHTEHSVVGLIAKVATIRPVVGCRGKTFDSILAVHLILRVLHLIHSLVHPVPNGATHHIIGAFDSIPIVLEIAHGVTHRMGILGDVERIFGFRLTGSQSLNTAHAGILVRAHINYIVVALILHGARGIKGLDGGISLLEIVAWAGLIAKTPDSHRGMVHIGVYHLHVARNMLILEFGHMGK